MTARSGASRANAGESAARSAGGTSRAPERARLEAVLLHPAIQRAAREPERFRGAADVSAVASQGLADEDALDLFEAHRLERRAGAVALRTQAEVRRTHARTRRH